MKVEKRLVGKLKVRWKLKGIRWEIGERDRWEIGGR